MFSFEEFCRTLEEEFRRIIPAKYNVRTKIGTIEKLNDTYTGLSVTLNVSNATMSINLDQLYRQYQDGVPMNALLDKCLESFMESKDNFKDSIMCNVDCLRDYESVKERLFIRVSSAETNEAMMEKVPCRVYEDLLITFHVLLNNSGSSVASTIINNDIMESYEDVTVDQLYKDALENSEKIFPVNFSGLGDFMGRDQDENQTRLYVLTNKTCLNGAAVMFYPNVLDEIAEKIGDYYVIPSSIHELILLPAESARNIDDMNAMVREVNEYAVDPCDQLTNHVYSYSAGQLRPCY